MSYRNPDPPPLDDIVVDIETVAPEWAEIDEPTRRYLAEREKNRAKWDGEEIDDEEADHRAEDKAALNLGLVKIVAIGMRYVEARKTVVVLEDIGVPVKIPGKSVHVVSETLMLQSFWAWLDRSRMVTCNGRGYDGPVIMVRSAQLGIRCARNLVPYRYEIDQHCDLFDAIAGFGAVRGGFTVDYWCRRFGIESPKEAGVDGSMIAELYRKKDMQTIGEYVARDVEREADLFNALKPMLCTLRGAGRWPERKREEEPQLQLEATA